LLQARQGKHGLFDFAQWLAVGLYFDVLLAYVACVGIVVAGPADTQTPWQADRSALFTLLKNLLENAIQHAPAGTQVRVEFTTSRLTVRDWGPGVGQAQLPQIFTRFWRGAHRRDHGAGLGLTICQEIARAHGWTLVAQREEPGLSFCLSRHHAGPG
jgi:signal transduction histidine kinase